MTGAVSHNVTITINCLYVPYDYD